MKKLFPLVTALALASAAHVFSQSAVSWTNGAFSTNAVLSLAGTPAQVQYAINLGGAGGVTTANGYTFLPGNANPPNPNVTASTFNIPGTFFPSPATTGDSVFNTLLGDATFINGGQPTTYTLNNLIIGRAYNALFLMADTRGGSGGRTFSISSGVTPTQTASATQTYGFVNGTPSAGGYAMASFIATSTSQVFSKPGDGQLNSIIVAAVPEPASTAAVLALGVGALAFIRHRRNRQQAIS